MDTSPVYTTFLARYSFDFGPGAWNFRPGTLHFCRVIGKICSASAPKHRGAETTYPHGLSTRMFLDTRATNFSIYTTKMEGARPKILGTGAKFKRVPCQKGCRVNRATVNSFSKRSYMHIIITFYRFKTHRCLLLIGSGTVKMVFGKICVGLVLSVVIFEFAEQVKGNAISSNCVMSWLAKWKMAAWHWNFYRIVNSV